MDIRKYTGFFHDGSIIGVYHTGDALTISMESAEMDIEDLTDDVALSENNRMKGKLHLEELRNYLTNHHNCRIFDKTFENAEIFRFIINQNKVELQLLKYSEIHGAPDFFTFEFEADKIWWENRPDLTSI